MKADMDAQGNVMIIAESGAEGYALMKWYEGVSNNMKSKKLCWESISIEVNMKTVKEEAK